MTTSLVAGAAREDALAILLSRIAQKDRNAFRDLYRETSPRLFGVVATIIGRGAQAEEILQEVYVRIWERAGDFRSTRGEPIAWLVTIARHRAIDELRRRPRMVSMADAEELPADFEDPLANRERSESLQALMRCLSALDADRRQAVLLAYYRGASREFLSARFGRPIPTIKTWLRRSLAQLRTCMAR